MEKMEIGVLIKALREKRNMSQRQLAYLSRLSNSTISRLEKGDRSKVTVDTLKKLARPLGVPEEMLFEAMEYLPSSSVLIKTKAGERQVLNLDDILKNDDIEILIDGKPLSKERRRALISILGS